MEFAGGLVEFSVSVIKLLNSGAWSVESAQSDFRAIFLRLRVSRSAIEAGRMGSKPGRLPVKPGGEALASSGNRATGGIGSYAMRQGLRGRAARSDWPGATHII